ncbi:MAG TPA: decarboxylating 6-phosphogluconate dehydrogenase [Steroidobacteraceae bacterium]|jgi:6-phosphogluconate dehydrogenase
MQIAMIGLGRMGANMVRRLLRAGHSCVVHDVRPESVAALVEEGAQGASSLTQLVKQLGTPRIVWLMLPAAVVSSTVAELRKLLQPGDIVIDGGNSNYRDALAHAREMQAEGLHFVDVGTSGGLYGLSEGYCLMIGGEPAPVALLEPIFAALAAPGEPTAQSPAAPAGEIAKLGAAERGYLHCGPVGAGHFVKMVHNGIEYGLMAAYAEGFNLLRHADRGLATRAADSETAPLAQPDAYQFSLNLPAIAELWRHGSVVRSWLLDLASEALRQDATLADYSGRVSDSGEGRWTLNAGVDLGIPMPTLAAALFARFDSRGEGEFADKLLSAMRHSFGGHAEKKE